MFGEKVPHRRPAQPINEEVQYEFFAMGAVPEENGGAHGIGSILIRMQSYALVKSEIAE